ncbi:hypothetical protein SDC9_126075 [bioreactor metagenome]|uniref:Uncharacterized protein n=1 Tax=bioreactor metagenome TaxID=1076179 RepID=A0A645CQ88_9ZZZZ
MPRQRTLAIQKDRDAAPLAGAADQPGICLQVGDDNRHLAIANALFPREGENGLRKGFRLRPTRARAKDCQLLRVAMIDLGGIGEKISLDMPHQRIGPVRLFAKPLLIDRGPRALRDGAQLQQHLPLRLKEFVVRALQAVDAQGEG